VLKQDIPRGEVVKDAKSLFLRGEGGGGLLLALREIGAREIKRGWQRAYIQMGLAKKFIYVLRISNFIGDWNGGKEGGGIKT